jgi:hypothetical protein
VILSSRSSMVSTVLLLLSSLPLKAVMVSSLSSLQTHELIQIYTNTDYCHVASALGTQPQGTSLMTTSKSECMMKCLATKDCVTGTWMAHGIEKGKCFLSKHSLSAGGQY